MSSNYEYKVKWCPICEQGWIEIMKDIERNRLLLICNECESEWENPRDINFSNSKEQLSINIKKPTHKEIGENGWGKYIIS
ncbi:hypothetical protein [Cytobacillus horneckiae]|uniref:hypothetical protein n=1 Tax=Cytobacillus horneckiae TaxID=549687 RepID=UPI003D9A290E